MGWGYGFKMYKRSNLGTFYTRKLTLVCNLSHNLGTFYARKLKFGMPLTKTKIFNSVPSSSWVIPWGGAKGQKI